MLIAWSVWFAMTLGGAPPASYAPEAPEPAEHAADDELPPPEVARGIYGVARRMQDATARADSGAYMATIDTTDPVFAQEQRNWARDLRTRPVETVRVRVMAGLARPEPDGDAWIAPMLFTWTLPDDPTERYTGYFARFRPLGLPDGAWLFAGRLWQHHPAEDARILFDGEDEHAPDIAAYLAARIPELRAGVETELDRTLPAAPTVKIYPDMESLQASIALSYTDPLGGWNEPNESIKILGRPGLAGPRLDTLIAHELGHAVSFEYGPDIINAPWWALEGIAEIAADLFRDHRPSARMLAEDGRLIDFARLADFRGEAMNHGLQVYIQGHAMLAYITDRFGRQARHDWLAAMGQGATLKEATQSVLGFSFDQLDQDWRATLTP